MIGDLHERMRIESNSGDKSSPFGDSAGGFEDSWATVATVWAKVTPTGGQEAVNAARVEAREMFRVVIRRRGDVTAADRLVWTSNGNKILNIRAVQDGGPREPYITLLAEAGVAT